VEEAQREERARLGPVERKLAVTVERLERSQDPELRPAFRMRTLAVAALKRA